jgi:ankyrin repeat protein
VVQLLLDNGADVAPTDMWGRCPIHFAASNDDSGIVNTLLKHGAHVDSLTQARAAQGGLGV